MAQPRVGVLALQGAFREHAKALANLGATPKEIRGVKDLAGLDAVVLPGGESTTIGKLLVDLNIMSPLRAMIVEGTPVFGTCAGMILLCDEIENSDQPRIGGLRAKVRRNAFGSQVDSFESGLAIKGLAGEPFPGVFIRAPVILETGSGVDILARVNLGGQSMVAAARQANILVAAFHPELTDDTRVHEYFLSMIGGGEKKTAS